MQNFPKISIVTPSFNQGNFLERTIRSVLDQKYPNLEYIIIDGNSTDGSVEIIKKYSHALKFWVSEPDKGQTDAIIKGFTHATGDIWTYFNSDDIYLPGSLELVARTLDTTKPQWSVGWQKIIDENDAVITRRPVYPFTVSDIWHNRYLVPQECTFFTQKMYSLIGGLDRSYYYAMDMHAWLRMASICQPILMQKYVGCFRMHSKQKTVMDRYFAECDKAISDISHWRLSHQMSACPPLPLLRGKAHKLAKAIFYLLVGGPSLLKEIYNFQRVYRT